MSKDVRKPQTSNRDRKNKGVSPEDAQKPFALYHAEHPTPQSSSTGSRLALEPLLGFYLQEREEERAKAAPSQGSGHPHLTCDRSRVRRTDVSAHNRLLVQRG